MSTNTPQDRNQIHAERAVEKLQSVVANMDSHAFHASQNPQHFNQITARFMANRIKESIVTLTRALENATLAEGWHNGRK